MGEETSFLIFEKIHGFDLKFFKQISENILGID